MSSPLVSIIVGSGNDIPIMESAQKMLDYFEVSHELVVSSAHRMPDKTRTYARSLRERGVEVVIAGAGMSAHLAGVVAAHTILPVIAVPIAASSLQGFDALLSMVMMPGGVPVPTMSIGKAGAKNAAILAVQILSKKIPALMDRLEAYKEELANG